MASVHTTYSFNTETTPASAHHDENENNDDDDRDGLFQSSGGSHTTTTNGSSGGGGNSPRRWYRMSSNTIFMSILIVVLGINIALILHHNNTSNPRHDSNTAASQTVSTKLYNALIPPWKPLPSSDTIMTTIAFGSCASQNMPQSFWDTIMLSSTNETSQQQQNTSFHPRPDLFIYTGDNVYGDCSSDACTELRMAYYNLSRHPSIQGIASQIPIIATLDDHDYGMNNCHAHNPYKDTAKELFQEFFNYSWDDLPFHDGVYQSYAFGTDHQRIQIILLDTRYGRSPFDTTDDVTAPFRPKQLDDIDQQMLSEFQWKWLQMQIAKEPTVVVRIVISSIQVLNDVTGFEAWRHLPMEQERLLTLFQKEPVIFLSGDRHVGGIYEMTKPTSTNRFVEITASSLTHSIPFGAYDACSNSDECDESAGLTRVSGPLVRENHYGTIAIDYEASMVTIALRRAESSVGTIYQNHHHDADAIPLHGDAGEVLIHRTYAFSEL